MLIAPMWSGTFTHFFIILSIYPRGTTCSLTSGVSHTFHSQVDAQITINWYQLVLDLIALHKDFKMTISNKKRRLCHCCCCWTGWKWHLHPRSGGFGVLEVLVLISCLLQSQSPAVTVNALFLLGPRAREPFQALLWKCRLCSHSFLFRTGTRMNSSPLSRPQPSTTTANTRPDKSAQ